MSELTIPYIREDCFHSGMSEIVEPTLMKIRSNGHFIGANKSNIYYECFLIDDPKGIIVLSHGFCESIEKYYELIYYFTSQQYTIYALEHRSHGRSDRLGLDHAQVHLSHFEEYVLDFKIFMDQIVIPNKNGLPCFLFGHSMGGGISALFLEEYPGYFQAAILNAPMMEIETGKFPKWTAQVIATVMVNMGKGKEYLIGHSSFTGKANIEVSGTSSESRYMYYHQKRMDNTSFQTDGGSFNWIKESILATKKLVKNASKIDIPILLFQAEKDTFVKASGQMNFAKKAKQCKIFFVEKAKHEIYFEKDEILFPYLKEVFHFYENHLKS